MPLKYLAITSLLLTLALPSTANAAGKPAPDHNHSSSQQLLQMKLNGGKKWQTDTALRQGMAAIHLELVEFMPAFHQGSLSSDELQRLASGIEAQVASIVANCKLDAQADAQLHIVIAQLLEGVEQLAGKQPDVNPTQGVITILSGIDSYTHYFDDPELAHSLQH